MSLLVQHDNDISILSNMLVVLQHNPLGQLRRTNRCVAGSCFLPAFCFRAPPCNAAPTDGHIARLVRLVFKSFPDSWIWCKLKITTFLLVSGKQC